MQLQELWTAGLWFGVAFSAVILFAAGMKAWDVWRTRHWFPVPGRVVKTGIVRRRKSGHRGSGERQIGNFAEIVYEYSVNGRSLRGKRVNITPEVADAGVEETLARYPVGSEVTVYCNPENLQDCVLEREWPRGLGIGVVGLILFIAAVAYGVPWALTAAELELAEHLQQPDRSGIVVLALAASLFVVWLWCALRAEQTRALAWPTVQGKVVSSHVEAFLKRRESPGKVPGVTFRPIVHYEYQVGERTYHGDRITLGGRGTGMFRFGKRDPDVRVVDRTSGRANAYVPPRWMNEMVKRYPVDSEITVFHDPLVPANSVLEPMHSGSQWFLLIVLVGLLTTAACAAWF